MMNVQVRYYTDPACPWSWSAEPALRRLIWEFEGQLDFAWVMGGLARHYADEHVLGVISHWLDAAESRMPLDPRIWTENRLESTYPACQAVKAAEEQGWEAAYRYLRRLREGMMFERRKLDHADALIAAAGEAGIDRARFEVDLRSHAITEAFGADLDEVRNPPEAARRAGAVARAGDHERLSFPSALLAGADGSRQYVAGFENDPSVLCDAALAAGAERTNDGSLEPLHAIARFGRCATKELEVLAGRPRPVIEAELWALAREWKLKPVPALTGAIWERA